MADDGNVQYLVALPFAGAFATREAYASKDAACEAVRKALEDSFQMRRAGEDGFDFSPLLDTLLDIPERLREVVRDRYRVPMGKKPSARFSAKVEARGGEVFERELSAPPHGAHGAIAFPFARVEDPVKQKRK